MWSPRGRFGDFWKGVKDVNSLAKEVLVLEAYVKGHWLR
jgi:hypothetical protein